MRLLISIIVLILASPAVAQSLPWYTQGDFAPTERYIVTITNPLSHERKDCPIVIPRAKMPIQDLHEMWVTVVDPSVPPRPAPTPAERARQCAHLIQRETNGYAIFHQMDDLDKDGIWDELYFTTDLPASGSKVIHLYLGFNQRGWNPHGTHAGLGNYARHLVPFWESKHVGWKLWFPTTVDVYAKRVPQLMSQRMYMENLDGYGVPRDMGTDVQSVDDTFGGGAICIFEDAADPTTASRPQFTPVSLAQPRMTKFNAGQISDTRYAFDVVANGPLRSSIRVRTMNWKTAAGGEYEVEQLYTAYANESYSTCRVRFTKFQPPHGNVMLGAGIRRKPQEKDFFQERGIVISAGPETILNPDEERGRRGVPVDFIGGAIVVRESDKPQYVFIAANEGNHALRVEAGSDREFEYAIANAWSEGEILKNYDSFKEYVLKMTEGFNHPAEVVFSDLQRKP
jgi:hypothetical protein